MSMRRYFDMGLDCMGQQLSYLQYKMKQMCQNWLYQVSQREGYSDWTFIVMKLPNVIEVCFIHVTCILSFKVKESLYDCRNTELCLFE